MTKKTVFAGFGGQGVLMMGYIFAVAAMNDGKEVTYLPTYGAEVRGGTANCTVVISDSEIGSPVIHRPVSVIAMNLPSLEKFGPRVKKGGLLVVNTSLIPEKEVNVKGIELLMVPTRELALEVGNERLTNMVILGAIVQKCGLIALKSLKKALYPALDLRYHKMIYLNEEAIETGARFVREM